ncbi:unnamed protein product [Amaranthus hypochondriacus]
MGAQNVQLQPSTNSLAPSTKNFEGLITPFLQPTKFNRLRLTSAISRIRSTRRQSLCAVISQKVDDVRASLGRHDEKLNGKRLAVFVSGGGSNFKALHAATLNGLILGDVVVLVTNKEDCGGATYAKENDIPVVLFPRTKESSPSELVTTLRKFNVDFILLAGFLKLIPVELVQQFPKRILNIHPSLLPAFGGKGYFGMKVHKAVIASGARYSGPTIHFVDEEYDTGRILAQRVVPVCAFDTPENLAARVLHEEHQLYVEVVAALCEDRIIWRDDGVPLIQSKEDPQHYS